MSFEKVKAFLQCLLRPRACMKTGKLLYEYAEGELDAENRKRLDAHLSDCPECLEYVRTYRRTVELTRQRGMPELEMPATLQRKLREFVAQHPALR